MIYTEITVTLNKLNETFLNSIRDYLHEKSIHDISAVQALMIKNIGDSKTNITQLQAKGYYTGTNVSYNLKYLENTGYIAKQGNENDMRSSFIRLTEKGLKALAAIDCALTSQHNILNMIGVSDEDMYNIKEMLVKFDNFI